MAELTERERISLLMMRGWGNEVISYKEVMRIFNDTFRNENNGISKSSVVRTVQRFQETGSVKNCRKSGRPATACNDDKALDVLQSFIEDPYISINRAAQQHEIGVASIHKILKSNKWHLYKLHLVQEF